MNLIGKFVALNPRLMTLFEKCAFQDPERSDFPKIDWLYSYAFPELTERTRWFCLAKTYQARIDRFLSEYGQGMNAVKLVTQKKVVVEP
ncbi:hypothetical protein D4S03_04620 [bacterium]|nr:MAG: hypothetical protein D4S03_04620 [bacterium]